MIDTLDSRRIEYLIHFTRAENLESIMAHGLIPRSELEEWEMEFSHNDEIRLDGCENAVCTSIEFPNYKMFWTLRCDNPNTEWAIILIDAKILCNLTCAFCFENAASANSYNMSIEKRSGVIAFEHLFDELAIGLSRKELGIPDYYPTNPQAEVLVFDEISVDHILEIHFENNETLMSYGHNIPQSIRKRVSGQFFKPRTDWRAWQ